MRIHICNNSPNGSRPQIESANGDDFIGLRTEVAEEAGVRDGSLRALSGEPQPRHFSAWMRKMPLRFMKDLLGESNAYL